MPSGETLSKALTRSVKLEISDSASLASSILASASSIKSGIAATIFFTSASDFGPSGFTAAISA